jgi:hypothetical protein
MARSDELLISRSSTFRSLRAFAASSFIVSSALLPSFLVGLADTGEEKPEKVVSRGEGADAMLSGREGVLTTRFAVWSGLGVIAEGSFDGVFF